jgi:hypothetical protein
METVAVAGERTVLTDRTLPTVGEMSGCVRSGSGVSGSRASVSRSRAIASGSASGRRRGSGTEKPPPFVWSATEIPLVLALINV